MDGSADGMVTSSNDKQVPVIASVSAAAGAHTQHRSASSSPVNIANGGAGSPRGIDTAAAVSATGAAGGGGVSDSGANANLSTTQLNEEKRALHAKLKAYEKEFQAQHNRQVTKQEDIAPVSEEYRRYKEVKQLLAARGK